MEHDGSQKRSPNEGFHCTRASECRDHPGHEWRLLVTEADRIAVIVDDITRLEIDVIVNAANHKLQGGGGVDGAIHAAAGEQLLAACGLIGGCETGDAVATPAFELPCQHVIHAVGPLWNGGRHGEQDLLRSCYRRSLEIAQELECRSIAFPCISTGIYGYPKDDACQIAIESICEFLAGNEVPEHVIFCCFSQEDGELYRQTLRA